MARTIETVIHSYLTKKRRQLQTEHGHDKEWFSLNASEVRGVFDLVAKANGKRVSREELDSRLANAKKRTKASTMRKTIGSQQVIVMKQQKDIQFQPGDLKKKDEDYAIGVMVDATDRRVAASRRMVTPAKRRLEGKSPVIRKAARKRGSRRSSKKRVDTEKINFDFDPET